MPPQSTPVQPVTPDLEEWRPVVGFEGRYEVSSLGRIRSFLRNAAGQIMKLQVQKGGYLAVYLVRDGRNTGHLVHRLVAEAFIGPCPPRADVNHIDFNRMNASASNLEYRTHTENVRHSVAARRHPHGERTTGAILTEDDVRMILRLNGTLPQKEIAAKFGVSRQTIYGIESGRHWRHVLPDRQVISRGGFQARGEAHNSAKLTESDVLAIRALNGAASTTELSIKYGVTSELIRMIQRRAIWKHIP